METARNTECAKQGHQQGALGVALAITVSKHGGCRDIVITIVSERDPVADEGIGRTNSLKRR
jgi:hypothetical protein